MLDAGVKSTVAGSNAKREGQHLNQFNRMCLLLSWILSLPEQKIPPPEGGGDFHIWIN